MSTGLLFTRVTVLLLTVNISPAALKPYHKAARWIALAVNPFVGLTRILYAGLEMGDAEEV